MKYISTAIVSIMIVFSIYGIIDNIFLNGRKGVGQEFNKGIGMFGPLFLSIVGIVSLVPLLTIIINSTLTPIYKALGLDPSMAVSTIIAIDMGGYQLANAVAIDPLIGKWASIVYSSMMGATIIFTLPVGITSINKKDYSAFSKGILFGIAAIPIGTFIGGVLMNVPVKSIFINLTPSIIFSIIIIFCLFKYPTKTINFFTILSKGISTIALIGLGLAIVKDFILSPLGLNNIPLFNLIGSTSEGILTVGSIGIILSGALPFIYCLKKWLAKPLNNIATKYNISNAGIAGFLLSLANNIATFSTLCDMKEKEKITNVAFAVCGAFVIGDHLAFVSSNAPEYIVPMMVAKLVSGIIAVILVNVFVKKD